MARHETHKRGSSSSAAAGAAAVAPSLHKQSNAAPAPRPAIVAANKRTVEWVMTSDVPTDISVEVAGTSFALHKFPLVSRSGRIRKLVVETRDVNPSNIKLLEIPGGAEVFEVVAKFCYGINFEITSSNVAVLRCAAHYLEMTDEYGDGNLISRTEAFIQEMVVSDFGIATTVLHNCENLQCMAEELKIITRCVEAIAIMATTTTTSTALLSENNNASSNLVDYSSSGWMDATATKPTVTSTTDHWWAEDLAILRIDFYQRVIAAMVTHGLQHNTIGGALMLYAQRYLKNLNIKNNSFSINIGLQSKNNSKSSSNNAAMEQEQRTLVEILVSMLPCEKNAISCSFLFGLIRSAIILDTSLACRLELEQRIGMQLEQASLDDLLIPSFSYTIDTLFDVDVVHRLVVNFLQQKEEEDSSQAGYESDSGSPPSQSSVIKVGKLLDNFLAEIAPDANLKLAKFIALAELLPDYARVVNDNLYRAIDIYLKAHANLVDQERKKLCKIMDVQKLSQEACSHAAQNDRLPLQVVVQVLYFEQVRLRAAMSASMIDGDHIGGHFHHKLGSGALSAAISPRDHYASIRRENRELKLEVARMRMRLTELEKDHVCMKQEMDKSNSSAHNFLHSFSKRLSRLNPFGSRSSHVQVPQTPDSRVSSRRRRHSIS